MKRAMFSVLTVVVLVGLTGCVNHQGRHPVAGVGGGCALRPRRVARLAKKLEPLACAACEATCGDPGDPNCADPCRRKHHCNLLGRLCCKERSGA